MNANTLTFALHLFLAILLGALVGLERQWRQRIAGTRTNALVAAGASAFVMSGSLIGHDPTAAGRIVSYVVSGVGFLGAGVIFKDGANIRGLNTAATVWCSAAIGVLCGLGSAHLAAILAIAVLLTNTTLRPLAHRLHPVLPAAEPSETLYEIVITCRETEEAHLRAHLLTMIAREHATLLAIHSEDQNGGITRLRAEIATAGRQNDLIERLAMHFSMEPSVTSLSWSIVPTAME
ncbi:MgtC/SapB family protein [Terracidiphilus sp.]|jgi:putative Mg2+ transporter-C (MgtC) family protein|uniref:MgtC/SapB family protein n=1 Tax=Terracidiphilus sp. TaxID=1964191 RepID=UPI003C2A264D